MLKQEQINNYYAKDNSKYLDKFNKNKNFLSFSFKALFLNVFIMAKHKLFGFYLSLFSLNILFVLGYIYPEYSSDSAILLFSLVGILLFLVFIFNFNNLILKKAAKDKTINSSTTAFILGLIFFAPQSVFVYDAYKNYQIEKLTKEITAINKHYLVVGSANVKKHNLLINLIPKLGNKTINQIDDGVVFSLISNKESGILKQLKTKNYNFKTNHLITAINSSSLDIINFIAKNTNKIPNKLAITEARFYIKGNNLSKLKTLFKHSNLTPKIKTLFSSLSAIKNEDDKKQFYNYLATNIPLSDKKTKYTYSLPLYYTTQNNQLEATKILVKRGQKISDLNTKSYSSYAIDKLDLELLEFMVANGFKPKISNLSGIKDKNKLELFLGGNLELNYEMVKSVIKDNIPKFNKLLTTKLTKDSFKNFSKYQQKQLVKDICFYQNTDVLEVIIKFIDSEMIFAEGDCYNTVIMNTLINNNQNFDFNQAQYVLTQLCDNNFKYKDNPSYFKYLQDEVVKDIINNTNYSLSATNKTGSYTDLHYLKNKPNILKLSLDKLKKLGTLETLINNKDKNGKTPIFYAAKNVQSLKLFVDYGADLTIKDLNNRTIFSYVNDKGFNIIKSRASKTQLAEYQCYNLVEKKLDKTYQNSCNIIAKTKDNIISKTFALFMGGDTKALLSYAGDMKTKSAKTHYYGMANIGHGYLLIGDLAKTEEFYQLYLDGAILDGRSKKSYTDLMFGDFKIIKGIYGEDKYNQAIKIWDKLVAQINKETIKKEAIKKQNDKIQQENKTKDREIFLEIKRQIALNGESADNKFNLKLKNFNLSIKDPLSFTIDIVGDNYNYYIYDGGSVATLKFTSRNGEKNNYQHFVTNIKPLINNINFSCNYDKVKKLTEKLTKNKDQKNYPKLGLTSSYDYKNSVYTFNIIKDDLKNFKLKYDSLKNEGQPIWFEFTKDITNKEKQKIKKYICSL